MLFSEPKIPQFIHHFRSLIYFSSFSALQRAENSSILKANTGKLLAYQFQCSSASRKFLNSQSARRSYYAILVSVLFSEPKIPQWEYAGYAEEETEKFQCSSASRKFLNARAGGALAEDYVFQCSSASRKFLNYPQFLRHRLSDPRVSVLFSEPKIPQ